MHQHSHQGAAQAVPTLDARDWLAAWADNGGVAVLAGERLFVSRAAGLDRMAAQRLNDLRTWLYRPGARDALAGVLGGEVAA